MGAIYGVVGLGGAEALAAMGARLSHRGLWKAEASVGGGARVGCIWHRSPDASIAVVDDHAIVADVDLLNDRELRAELERRGHRFESASCEETILRAYLEVGADCCTRLDGHFAFAIWNASRGSLLVAKDPVGSRPVYYWMDGGCIAFASEYKALLALPEVPARPDLPAIQYLQSRKLLPLLSLIRGNDARNYVKRNPVSYRVAEFSKLEMPFLIWLDCTKKFYVILF